jgi:hypothetical protein
MTEHEPRERSAYSGGPVDLVVHKAARECYMIEPHRREICGIIRARELAQAQADALRRDSK